MFGLYSFFFFFFFMAKKGDGATIMNLWLTLLRKRHLSLENVELSHNYYCCEWPPTLSYPYERANKLGVNFKRHLHLLLLWGPQTSSYPYNRASKLGVNGNSTIRIGPQERERVGCTHSHRYKGNPRPPIIRQKTKLKKLTFLTNISALVAQ